MVDVDPTNAKLRDRAIRIVRTLTRAEPAAARSIISIVKNRGLGIIFNPNRY